MKKAVWAPLLLLLASPAFAAFTLKPVTVPAGVVGSPYSAVLQPSGGSLPYHWTVAGALPPGLTMVASGTGKWKQTISGSPTMAGSYPFTVAVVDAVGRKASVAYTLKVTSNILLAISPQSTTIDSAGSVQFTAAGGSVYWSATCGTIVPSGFYQAPAVDALTVCQVTVTATQDPSKTASALVTINPPPVTHTVALSWQESDPRAILFNVYRGGTSGGPYLRIGQATALAYDDTNIKSGDQWFYVVTAVDSAGLESERSNEAAAVVPTP